MANVKTVNEKKKVYKPHRKFTGSEQECNDFGLADILHCRRLSFNKTIGPLMPHAHINEFEIIFVEKGSKVYFVNEAEFHLQRFDVLIVFPGESHSGGGLPDEKAVHWCLVMNFDSRKSHFLDDHSSEFLELREKLAAIQNRCFRGSADFLALFKKIIHISRGNTCFKKIRIRSVLTELLSLLYEISETTKPGSDQSLTASGTVSEIIKDALACIEENIFKTITAAELADEAGLSEPRFRQRFKNETGLNPAEYILRKKIETAKQLLAQGTPVLRCSCDLSFSSSQYFASVFKKYTSVTPSEFRAQAKKS